MGLRYFFLTMKQLFLLVFACMYSLGYSQISEPMAMNTPNSNASTGEKIAVIDTVKKLLNNSDFPGITFLVSTNIRENQLRINTNFTGTYKVRFVDYYSWTRKVFKNNSSDITLNLSEFEKSIFIMTIMDSENRTLTSQVINLKRRHL